MAFGNIGLSEPVSSAVTKVVAAVTINRGSTTEYQELLTLADAQSSLGISRVIATAPPSTEYGLVVRIASGPSSAVDLSMRPVFSSTNTDNPVRAVLSSTNTDNVVRAFQGPGISSLVDRWLVNAANSSAADYHGVRLVDSSGTGYHGPTNPMPVSFTDSSNAVVKPADAVNNAIRVNVVAGAAGGSTNYTMSTPSLQTYAASTTGQSSATTIVSSNANTVGYIMGYSLTSTEAGPVNAGFYSGSSLVWPVLIWAGGGVPAAQQVATYPSYLFKGSTGQPLTFNVSSTGAYRLGVTYWTA